MHPQHPLVRSRVTGSKLDCETSHASATSASVAFVVSTRSPFLLRPSTESRKSSASSSFGPVDFHRCFPSESR